VCGASIFASSRSRREFTPRFGIFNRVFNPYVGKSNTMAATGVRGSTSIKHQLAIYVASVDVGQSIAGIACCEPPQDSEKRPAETDAIQMLGQVIDF